MAEKLKKVLVIGSGPIIIGQAAEFDYAGTQACRALKEEGLEVVLINSNPATIMTDEDIADRAENVRHLSCFHNNVSKNQFQKNSILPALSMYDDGKGHVFSESSYVDTQSVSFLHPGLYVVYQSSCL